MIYYIPWVADRDGEQGGEQTQIITDHPFNRERNEEAGDDVMTKSSFTMATATIARKQLERQDLRDRPYHKRNYASSELEDNQEK